MDSNYPPNPLAFRKARKGKKSVAVVIPYYRHELTTSESVSLQRCVEVLGSHPIFLISPHSLCHRSIQELHPQLKVVTFDDFNFSSIDSYNRLMLADEFYARFADYEFMLIHQLDSFVFEDHLLDWCESGFDYIGAPWLPEDIGNCESEANKLRHSIRRWIISVRAKYYQLKNRQVGKALHPWQYLYCSGNGGFSLRRIRKVRDVLRKSRRISDYLARQHFTRSEDTFFSIEANRYRTTIRTPDLLTSLHFSWETAPQFSQRMIRGRLPFGCHAWDRQFRSQWKPIFEGLGYDLTAILES